MRHLLAAVACRARYRGINTDKSKVAQFQRAEADTGSSEVQIAQLTARVAQLTSHLQTHRKDYASTRGLMKVRHPLEPTALNSVSLLYTQRA